MAQTVFEYPAIAGEPWFDRFDAAELRGVLGRPSYMCSPNTVSIFITHRPYMFVHLIVIGWLYVVVMMAVAEATNTNGTVLGAIVTFLMYGLAPVALVVYLMGAPGRRKAIRAREIAEQEAARKAAAAMETDGAVEGRRTPAGGERAGSGAPDAGGESSAAPVAPVRKET
ncbi:hypothetical protein [Variovorax rhizosphaerae]|uniref:DUF4282 domain-containing protein n=1 Tax=Variovorax rhizosphaerae TaxID=1836200 RepID=A0ABU8WW86_9BURK